MIHAMKSFVLKYLLAECKKNPKPFFKGVLLLIPILSIVGMFATVQMVPHINQQSFLKRSDYEWLYYSDAQDENKFSFRVMETTVAHIFSTDGGVFYNPSYGIELFFLEKLDPSALEGTYFNEKNVLAGDLRRLLTEKKSLGIALSYNAAKQLKSKVGDTASLIFQTKQGDTVFYPVTIQAILRPKYIDGSWGGLGLALVDSHFLKFLNDHRLHYQSVMFGKGEQSFPPTGNVVYKKDQLAAASLNPLSDQYLVTFILAAMGAVVVYLIIHREVRFAVTRRMRTIGILSALGTPKRTILQIFWLEQTLIIVIASLLSGIVYKYLLMELYVGEYIGLTMWVLIVSLYIILGLISLQFVMERVKKIMVDFSIPEIISKKPEEL